MLMHCKGTVLKMEALEDIDEACWLTITVEIVILLINTRRSPQDGTEAAWAGL